MYWIVFLCACAIARAQQNGPVVNITQGSVMGRLTETGYMEFHGIPYAGPTSGANRFKAPTPAPRFEEVFQAVNANVRCARPTSEGIVGVEDCLTVSIYTNDVTLPKPVLVYLHEEDFGTWNTGTHSYTRFVNSGLVVVTLNYRLSIFGFLCLRIDEAPGNAGLKDIVQGLQWIQDNIARFGGDSNNVILMGHGSGAAMADLVTLSPLTANLVHKIVTFSGSGLAPWAVAYDPIGNAMSLGARLGHGNINEEELARLLTTTELNILATALRENHFPNSTVLFAPCLEDGSLNPSTTILTEAPINLLRSGRYNHIPYIAGITAREGTIRAEQAASHNWVERMRDNFGEFIPVDLNLDSTENKTEVLNLIREHYFRQETISMDWVEEFLDYHEDVMIVLPVIRHIRERALTSSAPVRLLEFEFNGVNTSDWPFEQIPVSPLKHGAFLNFVFEFNLLPFAEFGRGRFMGRITQFLRLGNPNFRDSQTILWSEVSRTGRINVLYIGGGRVSATETQYIESSRVTMNERQVDFWNPLYTRYYEPPKGVSSTGKLMCFTFIIAFSQFILRLF